MSFPTELDPASAGQIIRFVTGSDRDIGRLALALWDVAGFGLGKLYPEAKFLADAVTAEPELAGLAADGLVEALTEANGEKLLELLEKYGPAVARLLLKLLLKV